MSPRRALHRLPLVLLLVLRLPVALAQGEPGDALFAMLAQRPHTAVSFVEQHFMHLMSRPVESWGELRFDAPDRLEKRVLEPRREDWVVQGDSLELTRAGRTRTASLADYPQMRPLIEGLRATLGGDRATLERLFTVQYLGDLERWALLLVPLDPQATPVAQIRIEGTRARLLEVEVRERDGDRTRLTLREHDRS